MTAGRRCIRDRTTQRYAPAVLFRPHHRLSRLVPRLAATLGPRRLVQGHAAGGSDVLTALPVGQVRVGGSVVFRVAGQGSRRDAGQAGLWTFAVTGGVG